MNIPSSSHFSVISLKSAFNIKREALPESCVPPRLVGNRYGLTSFRGIPFELGEESENNVVLLETEGISIEVGGKKATYFLFLHVLESKATKPMEEFSDEEFQGNELGSEVSTYEIHYDRSQVSRHPILQRFAIQGGKIGWGASPFACVPAGKDQSGRSNREDILLDKVPLHYGLGESRHFSARNAVWSEGGDANLWIYALPNPHPEKEIHSIKLIPRSARSVIYAVSLTELGDHPCRYNLRKKLLLTLPGELQFNAINEIDDIEIDLGNIISARRQTPYDHSKWTADETDIQPEQSPDKVLVEYAAHPAAKIYVGSGKGQQVIHLSEMKGEGVVEVASAHRPIQVRVIDKKTQGAVGVRIHFHGEAGEYLPPKGYHRTVNTGWFEDVYGEFKNGSNQYVYIHGNCILDAPLGVVYVEISRGYEVSPIRTFFEVTSETKEIYFELENVLDWRSRGWVTADTHVHFLSPTTAVLEGEGEGVNVVNVLASQWGEMFSNVGDFDGQTTHSNNLSGKDGEFIARVGTENRMQVLGHISLLGYSGEMIHPLCTGGPSESAIGDAQEVTMADWAQQCINQQGLVVMPHAPNPQCERAADIVLELVNAMEFMTFNPSNWQISPFAVADWYRFLNLGYRLPLVGGSDKMNAASQLGGIRTYTQLGNREFTYENWMEATREGNTFVTVGPLIEMNVDGTFPGGKIQLPVSGGSVSVSWKVESVSVPIESVEIVVGGRTIEESTHEKAFKASGSTEINVDESTWIALRVRGSKYNRPGDLAAHTSAVQVFTGDKAIFRQEDALDVLNQIEGAIAYVDTLAPRPDAQRYKKLRMTLESAYSRMHQRLHAQGMFHQHSPLHQHGHEH